MEKARKIKTWTINSPQLPLMTGYCPYCNKLTSPENMTEEHVIPKAIQRKGLTISVCKQCNDYMGHNVDIRISRQTVLRILGTSSQSHATIHEQHRTQAKLKDGNILEGHLVVATTPGRFKFTFAPLKRQPDGTRWIMAASIRKPSALPPEIHVFHGEDVEEIKVPLIEPMEKMEYMGPAFAKIFLGFAYSAWGYKALSSSSFDPIRDYIHGRENASCMFVEMDAQTEHQEATITPPKPLKFPNHLLWGEAISGKLIGGVSLFAKVAMCIIVSEFDLDLEGRAVEVENVRSGILQLLYGGTRPPTRQEILDHFARPNADSS